MRSLNFLFLRNFSFTRITTLLTELYRFRPKPAPIFIRGNPSLSHPSYHFSILLFYWINVSKSWIFLLSVDAPTKAKSLWRPSRGKFRTPFFKSSLILIPSTGYLDKQAGFAAVPNERSIKLVVKYWGNIHEMLICFRLHQRHCLSQSGQPPFIFTIAF